MKYTTKNLYVHEQLLIIYTYNCDEKCRRDFDKCRDEGHMIFMPIICINDNRFTLIDHAGRLYIGKMLKIVNMSLTIPAPMYPHLSRDDVLLPVYYGPCRLALNLGDDIKNTIVNYITIQPFVTTKMPLPRQNSAHEHINSASLAISKFWWYMKRRHIIDIDMKESNIMTIDTQNGPEPRIVDIELMTCYDENTDCVSVPAYETHVASLSIQIMFYRVLGIVCPQLLNTPQNQVCVIRKIISAVNILLPTEVHLSEDSVSCAFIANKDFNKYALELFNCPFQGQITTPGASLFCIVYNAMPFVFNDERILLLLRSVLFAGKHRNKLKFHAEIHGSVVVKAIKTIFSGKKISFNATLDEFENEIKTVLEGESLPTKNIEVKSAYDYMVDYGIKFAHLTDINTKTGTCKYSVNGAPEINANVNILQDNEFIRFVDILLSEVYVKAMNADYQHYNNAPTFITLFKNNNERYGLITYALPKDVVNTHSAALDRWRLTFHPVDMTTLSNVSYRSVFEDTMRAFNS